MWRVEVLRGCATALSLYRSMGGAEAVMTDSFVYLRTQECVGRGPGVGVGVKGIMLKDITPVPV